MSNGMTKLTVFAVVIVATASLLVGVNTVFEQDVKAQNMTTNMTGGNSTVTDGSSSGSISSLAPAPPE
jgi:hypothetical protein